jgi:hypothetical protein
MEILRADDGLSVKFGRFTSTHVPQVVKAGTFTAQIDNIVAVQGHRFPLIPG